jgi:hypothetical protein
MGMFEELIQYNAAPKPEKHQTEEERRLELAVRDFVHAERKFKKLNDHPLNASNKEINLRWWDALEAMYTADKALWHLFCGPDKSMASNLAYGKFRKRLVTGLPNPSDA